MNCPVCEGFMGRDGTSYKCSVCELEMSISRPGNTLNAVVKAIQGDETIKAIKMVWAVTSLGLKEAKDLTYAIRDVVKAQPTKDSGGWIAGTHIGAQYAKALVDSDGDYLVFESRQDAKDALEPYESTKPWVAQIEFI